MAVVSTAAVVRPNWIRLIAALTRARVTVAVTLTTATGWFLASGGLGVDFALAVIGVYLLASGSSALNQCQERPIDARMLRTRHRPLPSGWIDLPTALFIAGLFILLGLALLASVRHQAMTLVTLGLAALVWYNGVYTYLKRVTPFAVVPGALIGSIPPLIGYVAAGGDLGDPRIALAACFFFVWQIPHFWLLLLLCGEQYSAAGLPSLTRVFTPPQLRRITFVWIAATAVAGLTLPAADFLRLGLPADIVVFAASLWLVNHAWLALQPAPASESPRRYRKAFARINIYAVIIMICLSIGGILHPAG